MSRRIALESHQRGRSARPSPADDSRARALSRAATDFVVCGNFLMYYENEKESVFHPKGVWCLDDCRVGMMKRPGLGEKQACLLRGKRELVITADSLEELKAWNKAVQQARKYTPTRFADLEQRAQQDAAKLQRQIDSTIVELELTRSKLREERQHAARMHSDLAAAKEAGYKLEANVQEAERRQKELKLQSAPLSLGNARSLLDSQVVLPCSAANPFGHSHACATLPVPSSQWTPSLRRATRRRGRWWSTRRRAQIRPSRRSKPSDATVRSTTAPDYPGGRHPLTGRSAFSFLPQPSNHPTLGQPERPAAHDSPRARARVCVREQAPRPTPSAWRATTTPRGSRCRSTSCDLSCTARWRRARPPTFSRRRQSARSSSSRCFYPSLVVSRVFSRLSPSLAARTSPRALTPTLCAALIPSSLFAGVGGQVARGDARDGRGLQGGGAEGG